MGADGRKVPGIGHQHHVTKDLGKPFHVRPHTGSPAPNGSSDEVASDEHGVGTEGQFPVIPSLLSSGLLLMEQLEGASLSIAHGARLRWFFPLVNVVSDRTNPFFHQDTLLSADVVFHIKT